MHVYFLVFIFLHLTSYAFSKIVFDVSFHHGLAIDQFSTLKYLNHSAIPIGTGGSPYNGIVFDRSYYHDESWFTDLQEAHRVCKFNCFMDEQMIERYFEKHKRNRHFGSIDAFLCAFPTSLCEMFMPMNKRYIFIHILCIHIFLRRSSDYFFNSHCPGFPASLNLQSILAYSSSHASTMVIM